MRTILRRAALPALLGLLAGTILAGQSQTPPPAQQAATTVQTAGGAPAPVTNPASVAYTAALQIREPDAKLAALEKIRADFPQSPTLISVDSQLLMLLVTSFPDRVQPITDVFERAIGRIATDATPDQRLTLTITPVNQVVGKKLLLDRSEQLMTTAVTALDEGKYADAQKAAAKRTNRPEPTAEVLRAGFGSLRSRGLELLARIYAAKGNAAKAEATYKDAVTASATFGPAVTSLVDIYVARKDFDYAEAVLKDSIKAAASPAVAARPTMALADVYEKKGDDTKLEALLKDAVKANPAPSAALTKLAKLEVRRGDNASALEHFLTAAVQGGMSAADDAAMRTLYRKLHNNKDDGIEELLDKMYDEKLPNPVKPEAYTPLPNRSDRLVLLEMFTGSACPPCVAADLAYDVIIEHYPAGTIIPVAYHQHIPGPDPMVTAGSAERRLYYAPFRGVPTFNIDGGLGRLGGGARAGAPNVYKDYIAKIDKALQTPAEAALTVAATGDGDRIVVTANVTRLPANTKDLRLHILLVERHLRFLGENGIRHHPMVVRASAGELGRGIPITATGKTEQTFSLVAIKDDVTKSLQAEIEKRRKAEAPGAAPREYAAEGRPYVAINSAELSVVAFIQQGAYVPPAPSTTPATGIDATLDTLAQLARQGAPPATPPSGRGAVTPPPAGRTNVLQAAIAPVVIAPAKKGS